MSECRELTKDRLKYLMLLDQGDNLRRTNGNVVVGGRVRWRRGRTSIAVRQRHDVIKDLAEEATIDTELVHLARQ